MGAESTVNYILRADTGIPDHAVEDEIDEPNKPSNLTIANSLQISQLIKDFAEMKAKLEKQESTTENLVEKVVEHERELAKDISNKNDLEVRLKFIDKLTGYQKGMSRDKMRELVENHINGLGGKIGRGMYATDIIIPTAINNKPAPPQ